MTALDSNKPTKSKAVKLSYSSLKLLQSCEQRYAHYKVYETPKDSDYVESDSLGLGKAFHAVLEQTLHKSWNNDLLGKAMADNNVDIEEAGLLSVMLQKYVDYRKVSGLEIIKCEFSIETSMYIGFIDAIAIHKPTKTWWLVDLKTAARHDPNLVPQLSKDMQVGLYSHFVPDIQEYHSVLDVYTFGGFKYCQVIKSKAGTPKGLEAGVKVYEMTVPASLIKQGEAWSVFTDVHDRALELHQGVAPKKNYSACFNYFQPCPYFSNCHGNLFTVGHKEITVSTIDTYNEKDLL
jgi:hypothetical protein